MKTTVTSSDRSLLDLSELRRYGGLLKYLSLRDVFVRYKQTWMGFGWSVVRPLINVVIFGCLSWLVDRRENFAENFIMVSAGVVFWQLLSTAITEVGNSLVNNTNLLTKVYFPKLILPISSLLVCLIDFAIALALFLVLFVAVKGLPAWQIVFLPLVVAYGLLFCFGLGLSLATASVRYRDVRFIVPFLLQILFYAAPVFISSSRVLGLNLPQSLKVLYQLDPLVFMLNAFRFCFYGTFESYDPVYAGLSVLITFGLLFFSLRYFLNFEKSFTDFI